MLKYSTTLLPKIIHVPMQHIDDFIKNVIDRSRKECIRLLFNGDCESISIKDIVQHFNSDSYSANGWWYMGHEITVFKFIDAVIIKSKTINLTAFYMVITKDYCIFLKYGKHSNEPYNISIQPQRELIL